jgi:hypothetical protein
MHQADVAQAIATLQVQGKALSHGNIRRLLGYGSLRDIVQYRNELLPALDAAPAAPVPAALRVAEKPVSLCQCCGLHDWVYVEQGRWVCPYGAPFPLP